MDITMLLLADYAAADASNKLNVIGGGFNIIHAKKFPARHQLMHLVIQFKPELGEFGDTRKLRVVLMDQDSKQILEVTGDLQFPPHTSGLTQMNVVIGMRDIVFSAPGTYEFRVFVDKDQKANLALELASTEQPGDQ